MYKCKECGCEYEEKPDYCDCGNDEFVFVEEKPAIKVNIEESVTEEKKSKIIHEKTISETTKKSTTEHYLPKFAFLKSVDLISGIIFVGCLLMSFYVVFFAWNSVQTENTETKVTKNIAVTKSIPPIDSFWNNQLPKVEIKKNETKPLEVMPAVQVPKTTKVELKKIPVKQTIKPTVKTTKTSVPKAATTKTSTQNKTAVNKTQPASTAKAVQNVQQQPQTVKSNQKIAAEAAAEEAAKRAAAAQKAALLKQEYMNYKANLRNTIGRKIDFTRVVGDGSCTVAFKIDSNGRLVSRSFAKQSSNITLNDAVYSAVMSTPAFNPPPAGYNNEILNLSIRFYNGNFEITLN